MNESKFTRYLKKSMKVDVMMDTHTVKTKFILTSKTCLSMLRRRRI
jgi:hypothetical protein